MSFHWAKPYEPKHPFMRWLDERLPLPRIVYGATGPGYPVPRNLNYFWNFGVAAGLFLVIQIVTGIVLAMHYAATADGAFNSVNQLIMRDVNNLDNNDTIINDLRWAAETLLRRALDDPSSLDDPAEPPPTNG